LPCFLCPCQSSINTSLKGFILYRRITCETTLPFTGGFGTLELLDNHEFCTLIISDPFSHWEYAFRRSLHIVTMERYENLT
jgi:hypothetical protein